MPISPAAAGSVAMPASAVSAKPGGRARVRRTVRSREADSPHRRRLRYRAPGHHAGRRACGPRTPSTPQTPMDRLTPSTENAAVPPPVNLDPPTHISPPERESGMGQDPVSGPDQAEDTGRVTIDEDAARQADAEGGAGASRRAGRCRSAPGGSPPPSVGTDVAQSPVLERVDARARSFASRPPSKTTGSGVGDCAALTASQQPGTRGTSGPHEPPPGGRAFRP